MLSIPGEKKNHPFRHSSVTTNSWLPAPNGNFTLFSSKLISVLCCFTSSRSHTYPRPSPSLSEWLASYFTENPSVPKSYWACLQNTPGIYVLCSSPMPPPSSSHHLSSGQLPWPPDRCPTSLMTLLLRVANMFFQKSELALLSSIHISPHL